MFRFVRQDGLSGICITDAEYQQRVAFTMLRRVLDDFATKVPSVQWVCVVFSFSFIFSLFHFFPVRSESVERTSKEFRIQTSNQNQKRLKKVLNNRCERITRGT